MICYRDRTYCRFYMDCDNAQECDRKLTENIWQHAEKIGLPICQFMSKPQCHITLEERLEKEEDVF